MNQSHAEFKKKKDRQCLSSSRDDSTLYLPQLFNHWHVVMKELGLTPRQADVIQLALQAKQNKEIAVELGLEVSTVRMHLRYAYQKLGVTDRTQLALKIMQSACRYCVLYAQK